MLRVIACGAMALLKYQKKCDTLIERKIIRKNGNYEKIYTDNLLHIGCVYLCSLGDLDLFSKIWTGSNWEKESALQPISGII